jgi:hypothetical protein
MNQKMQRDKCQAERRSVCIRAAALHNDKIDNLHRRQLVTLECEDLVKKALVKAESSRKELAAMTAVCRQSERSVLDDIDSIEWDDPSVPVPEVRLTESVLYNAKREEELDRGFVVLSRNATPVLYTCVLRGDMDILKGLSEPKRHACILARALAQDRQHCIAILRDIIKAPPSVIDDFTNMQFSAIDSMAWYSALEWASVSHVDSSGFPSFTNSESEHVQARVTATLLGADRLLWDKWGDIASWRSDEISAYVTSRPMSQATLEKIVASSLQ